MENNVETVTTETVPDTASSPKEKPAKKKRIWQQRYLMMHNWKC